MELQCFLRAIFYRLYAWSLSDSAKPDNWLLYYTQEPSRRRGYQCGYKPAEGTSNPMQARSFMNATDRHKPLGLSGTIKRSVQCKYKWNKQCTRFASWILRIFSQKRYTVKKVSSNSPELHANNEHQTADSSIIRH